jgi:hypothetical protein
MTITPEQKAKELVERYSNIEIQIGGQYDGYLYMNLQDAKQCALICVDEILNINSVDKDYDLSTYWEEVKQEIEKL